MAERLQHGQRHLLLVCPLLQVNAAACALARRLTAAGVSRGSSVGVLLPRSFELVVSVLAIWKAGGVYVPLDPDFPDDRLAIYAEVSGAVNCANPSQASPL